MTRAEYADQKRRLEDDHEAARKALSLARANFDRIGNELLLLRIEWQEQQRREGQ